MAADKEKWERLNLLEKPEYLARWRSAADAQGMALSAWIRQVCRQAAHEFDTSGRQPLPEKKKGK